MIRPLVIAATFLLLLSGSASASGNSTFNRGVKAYNQGNYAAARQTFEAAVQGDPYSPYAHYYLANCLTKQGQYAQALTHYERAKALSSQPQLNEYCDQAINQYETLELTKDYYGRAAQQANTMAAKLAANLAAQQKMKQQMATKLANDAMCEANNHANRLNQQAEDEIQSMPRGRRSSRFHSIISAEIRADAKRKAQQTLEWGQQRAANYRKQAQAELDAYRESAVNLTSLMAAPLNRNGFGLSPYGTNLYVRNYTRPNQ